MKIIIVGASGKIGKEVESPVWHPLRKLPIYMLRLWKVILPGKY